MQETFSDLSQQEQVAELHGMLREHLLRRVKKDVLTQMPPKREQIVRVELSKQQKRYYKDILVKKFPTLSGKAGSGTGALNNVMMELRKCCNHPIFFEEDPDLAAEQADTGELVAASGKLELLDRMMPLFKERVRLLMSRQTLIYTQQEMAVQFFLFVYKGSCCGCARQSLPRYLRHVLNLAYARPSVPEQDMDWCSFQHCPRKHQSTACNERTILCFSLQGHRVLIYSQFTRTLDVLEVWLRRRGHGYQRIDGSVASGAQHTECQVKNVQYLLVCSRITTASSMSSCVRPTVPKPGFSLC